MKILDYIVCLFALVGLLPHPIHAQTTSEKLGTPLLPSGRTSIVGSDIAGGSIGNTTGATVIAPDLSANPNAGAQTGKIVVAPKGTSAPVGISKPNGVGTANFDIAPTASNGGAVNFSPTEVQSMTSKNKTGSLAVNWAPQSFMQLVPPTVDSGLAVCIAPDVEGTNRTRYIVVTGRLGGAYVMPATVEGETSPEKGLKYMEYKNDKKKYEVQTVTRFNARKKAMESFNLQWGWYYNVKTITESNMVNGSILGAVGVAEKSATVGTTGQAGITDVKHLYLDMGTRCIANLEMARAWEQELTYQNCAVAKDAAAKSPRDARKRKIASEACYTPPVQQVATATHEAKK